MMTSDPASPNLSHIGPGGDARMVDVSEKPITRREASASAVVRMRPDALTALFGGVLPKGDALSAARLAGIMAAKRTSEMIPLCHPLALDWVRVEFDRTGDGALLIRCSVKTESRTGVEMEAMTGASIAALTIYDMAKAADKAIVIGPIQLETKSGGRSGTYQRASGGDP